LSPALGETFKYVDGIIDLFEEIIGVEVPIAISPGLEDNPGFPDGCKMCQINV